MNAMLHLDEDDIDAALIGDLGFNTAAHLDACALCAGRVAQARLPLTDLRDVAMAWSERRSATLPVALPAGRRSAFGLAFSSASLAWSGVAAALLVLAVAVPVALHGRENASQGQAATQVLQRPDVASGEDLSQDASQDGSQDEIAQDNQLLRAVDSELVASGSESPASLGLQPQRPHRAREIFTVVVQD